MLSTEVVTKSINALNHEEHEGHEGKEKLFFVLFVVSFFSEPFATPSTGGGVLFLPFFGSLGVVFK